MSKIDDFINDIYFFLPSSMQDKVCMICRDIINANLDLKLTDYEPLEDGSYWLIYHPVNIIIENTNEIEKIYKVMQKYEFLTYKNFHKASWDEEDDEDEKIIVTAPLIIHVYNADLSAFKQLYRQIIGNKTINSTKSTNKNIELSNVIRLLFDSSNGLLYVNNEKIQLGKNSFEYYVCKSLFRHRKKGVFEDEVHEVLGESIDHHYNRNRYRNAVKRLNSKISKTLDLTQEIEFIKYTDKHIDFVIDKVSFN